VPGSVTEDQFRRWMQSQTQGAVLQCRFLRYAYRRSYHRRWPRTLPCLSGEVAIPVGLQGARQCAETVIFVPRSRGSPTASGISRAKLVTSTYGTLRFAIAARHSSVFRPSGYAGSCAHLGSETALHMNALWGSKSKRFEPQNCPNTRVSALHSRGRAPRSAGNTAGNTFVTSRSDVSSGSPARTHLLKPCHRFRQASPCFSTELLPPANDYVDVPRINL